MAVAEFLVEIAELTAATNQMIQASEIYEAQVNAARATAEELASKWEGDAKNQFVQHQETAYDFYKKMLDVVLQVIEVMKQAIEKYQQLIEAINGVAGSGV